MGNIDEWIYEMGQWNEQINNEVIELHSTPWMNLENIMII